MPIPSTGAVSFNNINQSLCLGSPYNQQVSLNDADVRAMFGKLSGKISMSDGRGQSKKTTIMTANGGNYIDTVGNWKYHYFTSTGTFTITYKSSSTNAIRVTMIGGGNSGDNGNTVALGDSNGASGGSGGPGGWSSVWNTTAASFTTNVAYTQTVGGSGYDSTCAYSGGTMSSFNNGPRGDGGGGGGGGVDYLGAGGNGDSGTYVTIDIGNGRTEVWCEGGGGGGGGGAWQMGNGGYGGVASYGGGSGGGGGGGAFGAQGSVGSNAGWANSNSGGGGGGGGGNGGNYPNFFYTEPNAGYSGGGGSGVLVIAYQFQTDSGC